MPPCTCTASWLPFLEPVLLAVAAVLSATAALVAARAHSTSRAVQSMWWSRPENDRRSSPSLGRNGSRLVARDRRRS